jgi:hypothetical protein
METLKENGHIMFKITDTGPGIPEEKKHLVFAEFGQIIAKRSGEVRSTGLGLTFCKMAVEAHGGKIGFYSSPKQGSTFWFSLRSSEKSLLKNHRLQDFSEKETDKLQLNENDRAYLSPFSKDLIDFEIYNISKIKKLLSQVENESKAITDWKTKVLDAANSLNSDYYYKLVKL